MITNSIALFLPVCTYGLLVIFGDILLTSIGLEGVIYHHNDLHETHGEVNQQASISCVIHGVIVMDYTIIVSNSMTIKRLMSECKIYM